MSKTAVVNPSEIVSAFRDYTDALNLPLIVRDTEVVIGAIPCSKYQLRDLERTVTDIKRILTIPTLKVSRDLLCYVFTVDVGPSAKLTTIDPQKDPKAYGTELRCCVFRTINNISAIEKAIEELMRLIDNEILMSEFTSAWPKGRTFTYPSYQEHVSQCLANSHQSILAQVKAGHLDKWLETPGLSPEAYDSLYNMRRGSLSDFEFDETIKKSRWEIDNPKGPQTKGLQNQKTCLQRAREVRNELYRLAPQISVGF